MTAELERALAVLATRFDYLEGHVQGLSRALWATAGSVFVAVVVFALSVASGRI